MSAPVIVVSGLPRSGTSLLMSLLESAGVPLFTDRLRKADADNPRGYFEHEAVKSLARDASWLPLAAGQAVKIVIPLVNHLPQGLNARVLLLKRDLDEILASQAVMLARSGRAPAPSEVLRPAFARMWEQSLALLEKSAPTIQTMLVCHRTLIHEPEDILPQIAAFLDRPLDLETVRAAIDPALHRQRAPRTS